MKEQTYLLYAVTDFPGTDARGRTLYERVERALEGGVTCVQLREKRREVSDFLRDAREMRALCHRFGVPLLIDDDVEVALQSGADGVHVGAEDMPVAEVRKRCGPSFCVGATAKTVEQARRAEADGADYLGVGALFPSPTKPNAIPVSREQLREICRAVRIPCVAIGGITAERVPSLAGTGICGIAVVSALFGADDVRKAAETLREAARAVVR